VADKKKTVAVELTAPGGKLDRDMRRNVGIVRKRSREAQREANRASARTSGRAGRGQSGVARAFGGAGRRAGGAFRGALAFGGFYGLQAEIRNAKAFEEVLVDLAVRGQKSQKWLRSTRSAVLKLSDEYGLAKESLAAYVQTIIDETGSSKLALGSLKDLSAVAFSTGADFGRLAGVVRILNQNLRIDPSRMGEAFGILAAQADSGAVALDQMDAVLPQVLTMAGKFGHVGAEALRDYGAALQFARRGVSNTAKAGTAMERMLDNISSKAPLIEKSLGIALRDPQGKFKPLGVMLEDIATALAKIRQEGGKVRVFRQGKFGPKFAGKATMGGYLAQTFGVFGQRAVAPLVEQAAQAGGFKFGRVGATQSFADIRGAGGAATIQERVARKRRLSPELDAWNKSVVQLRNRLHKHLLPAIKLLGEMMPGLGKGLTFVLHNWKLLLSIWTSHKLMMFFANMAKAGQEMRGGGGAGGFVGGGGRGGRRRGGVGRAVGALGAVGGIVGAGLEGVTIGMALTNAAGEFTDSMSGWSQALSSDEKWRKEVAAEAKAQSMFRQSGSGHKVFTKLRTRYAGTEEGRQAIAAGAGASQELTAAIQSGDQERIKKALTRAQAPLQALSSARKEMVEGQDLTPLQRQARRGLFGRMTGAQRQDAFPQLEELILLQRAGLQEMKNFRKLDRLTAEIAAAGKASVDAAIQASRSGKR
jgi:hypothetical protein